MKEWLVVELICPSGNYYDTHDEGAVHGPFTYREARRLRDVKNLNRDKPSTRSEYLMLYIDS